MGLEKATAKANGKRKREKGKGKGKMKNENGGGAKPWDMGERGGWFEEVDMHAEGERQIPTPNPKSQIGGEGKPYDMGERALLFAAGILKVAARIPREPGSGTMRDQLVRSGTAVGANYEESDGAETKPDKRKSLVTSRKEARESRYWLRLIQLNWGHRIDVRAEIQEATELILILSKMIQFLR